MLPNDIMKYLMNGFMESRDIVALALTSKSLYERLWDLKLHNMYHECKDEVSAEWNSNVQQVSKVARFGPDGHNVFFENRNGFERYKSSRAYDGYEVTKEWDIQCYVYPWRTHTLKLNYLYGPRDVDILTWYYNNKAVGYSML